MSAFERQQMLAALMFLVMALFVGSGYPPAVRWRRELRIAAIALFFVAIAIALIEMAMWWGAQRQ
jgi:hypothetical protein